MTPFFISKLSLDITKGISPYPSPCGARISHDSVARAGRKFFDSLFANRERLDYQNGARVFVTQCQKTIRNFTIRFRTGADNTYAARCPTVPASSTSNGAAHSASLSARLRYLSLRQTWTRRQDSNLLQFALQANAS